jgi:ABC-type dipeptide/oligopeptide/nickel transport system permease component
MKLRRKKIFRGVALAFAVAAFTASAAQAKPIAGSETSPTATSAAASYTPQPLRALELRSQGMNERYGLATPRLTQQQLDQQLRFVGVDKQHGLIGRTTTAVQSSTAQPVLASTSSNFSWGDAFAGAGAVFATAIILVVGFMAIRRREHAVGV